MHQLPGGEAPGWTSPTWTNFEFSWSNVWSTPITLLNNQNGKILTYEADFEQKTSYLEKGFEVASWLAFGVELAYAHRDGGVFDTFIDDFHQQIDSSRFRRQYYPRSRSLFQVTSDGIESFTSQSSSGLSATKLKIKLWPARWTETNPNCPCGIGFSFQAKVPMGDSRRGLSSGGTDLSGLVHIGVPLGADSSWLVTAGATTLGKNEAFKDWPRKPTLLIFDSGFDINLVGGLGLLVNVQMSSPLIDLTPLESLDPHRSDPQYKEKRLSTAWNSLVLWRVYESLGLRYRFESGARFSLLFMEDIGINDYDEVDDYIYVNGAPDFMLNTQLTIPF
jgi:hypothetical protein